MELVSRWQLMSSPMTATFEFRDSGHCGRLYSLAIAGTGIAIASAIRFLKTRKRVVDVPLEGASSGIMSSYRSAYEFLLGNPKTILRNAYEKYSHGTFRISGLARYTIVINKLDLIEEVRKAPDDKISFTDAIARWTFGENVLKDHYHIHVLRNQLTRSLGPLFDDLRDEIMQAFNDLIPAENDEWIAIPALDAVKNIVCRASNRIFVGTPLCRDADYIDLNINFTIDVMETVNSINKTPAFLRPIVGMLFSSSPRNIRRGMRHLRPLIEERLRMYDENGDDWTEKPSDMISWFIDEAPETEKRSIRELTKRILLVNFGAIHTSSNSFTHALFHLAAEPEYIAPLREEIERVINGEGWTKLALTKMWKLDSFMKESQRMNGVQVLTLNRKVVSDYTLSDGTFLPADTFTAANVTGIHGDNAYYPDANKFDGFRFSRMRDESVEESVKHQMVSSSADYLAFGHGRHACPGRFFAVNELKAMMAYLILNYDVKAEVEGVRPENVYMGTRLSPHPKAKVLIKRRPGVPVEG